MDRKRQETLREHFASPGATPRPILTFLNGDNSWLFSFPLLPTERKARGRVFYHVVFEPWLAGPSIVGNSWLIHMTLPELPGVPDAEAVEAVIGQIEEAAAENGRTSDTADLQKQTRAEMPTRVDAILLGVRLSDHTHEPTLRQFNENIPVIATPEVIKFIKPWGHFKTFCTIQDLDSSFKSWRDPELHPGAPVPSWLRPIRLSGHIEPNFSLAIVWSHPGENNGEEIHEAIFQSSHGIRPDEGPLQAFLDADPKVEKLAMLHGLKQGFTAGFTTALGVKEGLKFYRKVGGTKYWVATHNAVLTYKGLFMRLFVKDIHRSIDWALEDETKVEGQQSDKSLDRPNLIEVENGGCIILKL